MPKLPAEHAQERCWACAVPRLCYSYYSFSPLKPSHLSCVPFDLQCQQVAEDQVHHFPYQNQRTEASKVSGLENALATKPIWVQSLGLTYQRERTGFCKLSTGVYSHTVAVSSDTWAMMVTLDPYIRFTEFLNCLVRAHSFLKNKRNQNRSPRGDCGLQSSQSTLGCPSPNFSSPQKKEKNC